MANAISHLIGALLSIVALIYLVSSASKTGNMWTLVSTAIFGSTMIILYFSSTLTHILPPGRTKDFFFNFDRIAIYMLIAGTYTPIALVALHGPFGWIMFGIEWGLALTGILLIIFKPGDFDSGVNTFYVISYAVMGWLVIVAIVPIIKILPVMGWLWILIGGMLYSVGILFYKFGKFRYHHLVWHILVMTGTLSHFIAIFFYILPN